MEKKTNNQNMFQANLEEIKKHALPKTKEELDKIKEKEEKEKPIFCLMCGKEAKNGELEHCLICLKNIFSLVDEKAKNYWDIQPGDEENGEEKEEI